MSKRAEISYKSCRKALLNYLLQEKQGFNSGIFCIPDTSNCTVNTMISTKRIITIKICPSEASSSKTLNPTSSNDLDLEQCLCHRAA